MIGKTVKISDPSSLSFFYPSFKVRQTLTYTDRDCDVIYIGPMKRGLIDYLQANTRRFISTTGVADIDFSNRAAVLEWLYGKLGKEVPASLVENVKNYDDEYFMYCVKVFWVTGKWMGIHGSKDVTLYDLFSSSLGSFRDTYKTYNTLLEGLPAPVIESSYLTFLSRIKNIEDQAVSPGYMKLLKQCDAKFGKSIKPSVYKMAMRSGLRDDLLFLDLITDLR